MPQTLYSQKSHLSLLSIFHQNFTCAMLATAGQSPSCPVVVHLGCNDLLVHAQSCNNWCAKVVYLYFRKSALPPYQHVMQISGCMQFRATNSKLAHCTTLECVKSRLMQCVPRPGCCACSKSATMHSNACLTHAMIAPTAFFCLL